MKEVNFTPLGDRVLVTPDSFGEKKSKGGLILTETSQRGARVYGKVSAVGGGIFSQTGERIPMTVSVGDTVMYEKDMAGNPLEIDGEKYLLFNEHQLIGIVK